MARRHSMPEMWKVLSEDEVTRAKRFLLAQHRDRFVVGRATLRRLLARYLLVAPEAIVFRYGELGKPFVETHLPNGHGCFFNFTNSSDLALLAVNQVGELGVDVEEIRDMTNMDSLASRFFADAEVELLARIDDDRLRQLAFFRVWTRKEAFLKAIGKGLTFGLERVQVSLENIARPTIVAIGDDPLAATDWSLAHLEPLSGYVGAVAWNHGDFELRQFDCSHLGDTPSL